MAAPPLPGTDLSYSNISAPRQPSKLSRKHTRTGGQNRSTPIAFAYAEKREPIVVTRRDAQFVDHGPFRFVRNPMYTSLSMLGMSLGLALGTWLLPVAASLVFTLLALRTRTEEKYQIERFGISTAIT